MMNKNQVSEVYCSKTTAVKIFINADTQYQVRTIRWEGVEIEGKLRNGMVWLKTYQVERDALLEFISNLSEQVVEVLRLEK